ncbi:ribonuclease H-like domain-containing protein [Tanacetum coccineum]|uniref:Ribonuclease H-like domain-containing protein n=1 Tax=Tanacetum coccineum TaxID=301880 RepID=A0ABQ5CMS5_9ASTR
MPLEGIHVDDKLQFVEEPVEIMEREIKRLKQSRIPLVKVHWNSRRGPEFTWEREDSFKQKYPQLFTNRASSSTTRFMVQASPLKMQNRITLESFESDVKGSNSCIVPLALIMRAIVSENTISTNEVRTTYGASSSSAKTPKRKDLLHTIDNSSRRRDAWNTGNKAKDNGRRSGKQEEPKALVTLDGYGVDWTSHSKDEQENYALMEQLGDASIEIQAYTQALKKVEAQLVAHQQNQLCHLIRDCDFHKKRMAKQVELNKRMCKGIGQRENREQEGIRNASTPQQNRVAEKKNMTLIEAARTMLADSFFYLTLFWAEAVSTACYVLKSTPVSTCHTNSWNYPNTDLTNTDQDDSQIPALEDSYDNPNDGIFTNASYDDEGAVADFTNLEIIYEKYFPYEKKAIGTKWVYRNKKDERGVVVDPNVSKEGVYKFVKALYGLHQAPRAWYSTLSTFLLKSRYRRGTINKNLFIKKDKIDIMLVQVYVDDIIFGLQVKQKEDVQPQRPRILWTRMRKLLSGLHLYEIHDWLFNVLDILLGMKLCLQSKPVFLVSGNFKGPPTNVVKRIARNVLGCLIQILEATLNVAMDYTLAQDEGKTDSMVEGTAENKDQDSRENATPRVPTTTSTPTLRNNNSDRPRPTSTRSLLTLKPLPKIDPKDKGKKVLEEEAESDAESKRVQKEWETEEEKKKLAEEEATKAALIRDYDDIQARIEADSILAARLQEEEREKFTIEERAKLLHDTIASQRKFLAQQRAVEIRSRPPTRTQLRNQMMTYLKNVGGKKHSDLKTKNFEEIQVLYEKVKRPDENFIAIGSAEDGRLIKDVNKKATGTKKDDSIKKESKEEESTRKRKLAPDEDKEVDYEILDKKYPIIEWKTEYLGTKPLFDKAKHLEEINLNVVIRSNGKKRYFSTLMMVLSIFDRDDLNVVYQLVMDRYQDEISKGFDRDCNVVSWKLHGSLGVHTLMTDARLVIHMLVEKKYPLRKIFELIGFVKKLVAKLEPEDSDGDEEDL